MSRFWACHWKNKYWTSEHNPEGAPLGASGSNKFAGRGVSAGDVVYVISILDGLLLLGGRMVVDQVVSRARAVQITGNENLYDSAEQWALGRAGTGTPVHLHRRLAFDVTSRLRFNTPDGVKPPAFVAGTENLDPQTTRGVRELWHKSAALFDDIIARTDPPVEGQEWVTVYSKTLDV